MNKYSILALLPILFQMSLYADVVVCPDLDMLIKNELQAAQIVMNKPIKLELQAVLDALILFAGKSKNNRTVGIESILLIQKSVNQCKSQQYTTWSSFTSLFGFHPELVTREIQPALKAIDSSLKSLNVSQSEISTASKVIGTVTVGLALTGVVIGGAVWWATKEKDNATNATKDNYYYPQDSNLGKELCALDNGNEEGYNDAQLEYLYKIFGLKYNKREDQNNALSERYKQLKNDNQDKYNLLLMFQNAYNAIVYGFAIPGAFKENGKCA